MQKFLTFSEKSTSYNFNIIVYQVHGIIQVHNIIQAHNTCIILKKKLFCWLFLL